MRNHSKTFTLTTAALLSAIVCVQAQVDSLLGSHGQQGISAAGIVVYDNLGTAANAATSQVNANNPIFGDSLNMTSGGTVNNIGLSLFNSASAPNTANSTIITGTTLVSFYDNTVPYAGGAISGALLGTANLAWDFTGNPLPGGFYVLGTFDISSLNIVVPKNILVTQQFTMGTGTSQRHGAVLLSDPVVGSSPANIYIKSTTSAEGLYTVGGFGQLAYFVDVVPEPASATLIGLGLSAVMLLRRNRR